MKKIQCESCGNVDLVYKNGYLECKSCGMKYVITGIESPEKLKNYYTLARRAFEDENYYDAYKYYNRLLEENPNEWEAYCYSRMASVHCSDIDDLSENLNIFLNSIKTMVSLIGESNDDPKKISEIIFNVNDDVANTAIASFNRIMNMPTIDYDSDEDDEDTYREYDRQTNYEEECELLCYKAFLEWHDNLHMRFDKTDVVLKDELFIENYKSMAQILNMLVFSRKIDAKTEIRKLLKLIRKKEPKWDIKGLKFY